MSNVFPIKRKAAFIKRMGIFGIFCRNNKNINKRSRENKEADKGKEETVVKRTNLTTSEIKT